MEITNNLKSAPLASSFFFPALDQVEGAKNQRFSAVMSDRDWVTLGASRVIEDEPSGRAFLQKIAGLIHGTPVRSSFFDALASKRRLQFCREINAALVKNMDHTQADPFSAFEELKDYALYAGDGHFHKAAVHDSRDTEGIRHATGHIYMLNLRTQAMHHLDLCDPLTRKKEHDIHVMKRQDIAALRNFTPIGMKVIIAYDRAVLDFVWWQKLKDNNGVYFVSRPKSNTNLMKGGELPYNKENPVNTGIISNEQASPEATQKLIRRITWEDPDTGTQWQFLTNEMKLEPGLIVLLYRRRWDIEKVFDEFKNKLNEKKSWASSVTAKSAQATFMCLAHNLMVIYEASMRKREGICNVAEEKRRASRLEERIENALDQGRVMPIIISGFQRLTQRSVKYVRWLRQYLWVNRPLAEMHANLRLLYATL